MPERVLIFGDRNWQNDALVLAKLEDYRREHEIECVIEGEARGADIAGRFAAQVLGIDVLPFPAQWNKFGKAAGPIRNQQMLVEGKPTYGMGFHSDIEHSKGTKDMANRLKNANIPFDIFTGLE